MSPRTTSDDPRARRTREDLREALVSLVSEKGFEAARVRDLTERARVNRATFYKHYRDKWDLLEDVFEGAIADLEARMGPPPKDTAVVDLDDPSDAWVGLFEHLAERAGFYRAVLGEGGSPGFAARVGSGSRRSWGLACGRWNAAPPAPGCRERSSWPSCATRYWARSLGGWRTGGDTRPKGWPGGPCGW